MEGFAPLVIGGMFGSAIRTRYILCVNPCRRRGDNTLWGGITMTDHIPVKETSGRSLSEDTPRTPSRGRRWGCCCRLLVLALIVFAGIFTLEHPEHPACEVEVELLKGALGGALVGMGIMLAKNAGRRGRGGPGQTRPDTQAVRLPSGGRPARLVELFLSIGDTKSPIGEVVAELLKGGVGGLLIGIGLALLRIKGGL
jgi:hypothetical protein